MIDKVIKKYNLDVDSMKREGTIAFLTFLASWIFFGINNAILAYHSFNLLNSFKRKF